MLIIMDGTLATLPNTAIMDKNSNMKLEALLIELLMGGYDLANQCSSPEITEITELTFVSYCSVAA